MNFGREKSYLPTNTQRQIERHTLKYIYTIREVYRCKYTQIHKYIQIQSNTQESNRKIHEGVGKRDT